MSLAGAMNSGISGLQAFSSSMGVIGNNLANTNTAGFKASRTLFSDLIPDTVSGSGGTSQVGRGANLSTVDNIFTQGSIESTGSNLDLAIEGTGFFIVRNPDSQASNYTRAGTYRLNENGFLVNPEGYVAQGYASIPGGMFADLTSDIMVNTRSSVPGEASSQVGLTTNLNANTMIRQDAFDIADPVGTSNFATTSEIYDTLGNTHLVTTYFRKTGLNQWGFHQMVPGADLTGDYAEGEMAEVGFGTLNFNEFGLLEEIITGQAATDPYEVTHGVELVEAGDATNPTVYSVALSNDDADYVDGGMLRVSIDGSIIEGNMVEGSAEDSINALITEINAATAAGSGHPLDGVLNQITAADLAGGVLSLTAAADGVDGFTVDSAVSYFPGEDGAGSVVYNAEHPDWPNVNTIESGMLDWNNGSATDRALDYEMNITQFATESRVVTQQSDGYSSGYLTDITVDMEGVITGMYSNGENRSLSRLALGKFANDNGLEKIGNNLFSATRNSGPADIGTPGAGFGRVFSNSLEQSTVDIAEEFTRMITTQRSFQANSKTITTTDEMLSEVINMKR